MSARLLAAAFALAAPCVPGAVSPEAELTPGTSEASLALPRAGPLATLQVIEVVNPRKTGIILILTDNGREPTADRVALYPPDLPGDFPIRISAGATAVLVRLVPSSPAAGDLRVRVRLAIPGTRSEKGG